jgi:alkylhydroperoxidase/carboxymuconolactone decarboxylase family protein YurZ
MSSFAGSRREPARPVGFREFSYELGKMFFDYDGPPSAGGVLSERERALIALALASSRRSAEGIEAATERCLALGICEPEIMQALQAGSITPLGPAQPPREIGKKAS